MAKVLFFLSLVFSVRLAPTASAASGTPAIFVDGQAVTSSPVVRQGPVNLSITMTTSFPNGSMFYTLDGSEPNGASTRYTGAFTISSTKTIRAIAYSFDFSQSEQTGAILIRIDSISFSVSTSSSIGGTVTRTPDQSMYPSNTVVSIEAHPEPNFYFVEWITGFPRTSQNPLIIKLTNNVTAYARFRPNRQAPRWTFPASSPEVVGIAADADGNAFVAFGSHAAKILKSGVLAWNKSFGSFPFVKGPRDISIDEAGGAVVPILGSSGNAEDRIKVILPDGTVRNDTIFSAGDGISIGTDGSIYVPSMRSGLRGQTPYQVYQLEAFSPAGALKWSLSDWWDDGGRHFETVFSKPAIGLDRRLYFIGVPTPFGTNTLYCADANGKIEWKFRGTLGSLGATNNPVLGNNAVYIIDKSGGLVALSRGGAFLWRFQVGSVMFQLPSIGADGLLYLGELNDNSFFCLNPDGTVRWVRQPGVGGYGIPAIGADGSIYVTDFERIGSGNKLRETGTLLALDSNGYARWSFSTNTALFNPIISGTNIYTASKNALFCFIQPVKTPCFVSRPTATALRIVRGQWWMAVLWPMPRSRSLLEFISASS